jgi:transmembrane sensor
MKEKFSQNNKNHQVSRDILDRFSPDKQKEILEIWEKSGASSDLHRRDRQVKDVDQALTEVQSRLGFDMYDDVPTASVTTIKWRWYLAAAIILIVVGAGYLLIPRNYVVPYGEIAEIELSDGSLIELNSGTQMWHNRLYGTTNRTVHLDGEAFFTIRTGQIPFTVHANESIVEVTGTKFNIRSWNSDPGSETTVAVSEGEVIFYSKNSPDNQVSITPGFGSIWSRNMIKPEDPEPVSIERALGWRNNLLNFDEKPLSVILNELERRFDVRIDLEVRELRFETLTTYYTEQRDLESVLTDICLVKGIQYAETANGYRLFK